MKIHTLSGDLRVAAVNLGFEYDEIAAGFPIARDEVAIDHDARRSVPEELNALKFTLSLNYVRSKKTPDFLAIRTTGVNPDYRLMGLSTLVSHRAKQVIERTCQGSAVCVPTSVSGAPGDWFILWVEEIIAPVAMDQSTFISIGGERERLVPNRLVFEDAQSVDMTMFRLPQWKYVFDFDLVSDRVVSELREAGIRGALLRANGSGPPVRL